VSDSIALVRPAPEWRYIVQRATTGVILTREADISTDDEKYVLSASGSATFETSPVIAEQLASDGQPMFGKRRTLIAAEADGEIRWRGLVTDISLEGPTRTITVHSISSYPNGIPWMGPLRQYANVDPADIMRDVWAHVQSFGSPRSNLGVTVVGNTGLKVGTESTARKIETAAAYAKAGDEYTAAVADRNAAQADETAARKVLSQRIADSTAARKALTAAKAVKPKNPTLIAQKQAAFDAAESAESTQRTRVANYDAEKDRLAGIADTKRKAKAKAYDAKVAAAKKVREDGGSFDLQWWEAPDCGQTIDTLAGDNGFDWYERSTWNIDRSGITTEIVVAYPRAGRRRRDLVFEEGTNVTIVPTVEDSDDEYANVQILVGAGEGAGSVRRETSHDDGALRSVAVLSAKDVKTAQAADKRLKTILPTSLITEEVSSIEVVDHDNAPIGSWQVGDDIRVDFWSAAANQQKKLWHRVTSWTRTSDRTATLELRRSNAYTYGG
jgi:hypothetical protein